MRYYLIKKPITKKGLVEGPKVWALSSNPSTSKNEYVHTNPLVMF
jgi:hypothetical protein